MEAELSQQQNGAWKPTAFFSRKRTPTHQRCSTFDRELLAIYSAIQHFRYFLEGRTFTVFTDHKPLAPVPDQELLIASASAAPTVDLAQMAAAQQTDPNVSELCSKPGALQLRNITLDGTHILCDVSTGRPRPVVPPSWTKNVFDALHSLCHPGPKPTTQAISARNIWPGLKKDVKNMVRACHE